MNRTEYLHAYRAPDEVLDRLSDHGDRFATWETDDGTEVVFDMDDLLHNKQDLRSWLSEKTHKEYLDMVVTPSRPSEVSEWIRTDKTVTDYLTVYDLVPEAHHDVADLIAEESPGGDIRKYTSSLYGPLFSFSFGLAKSRKVTITGMEPFTMETVEQLLDLGVAHEGMYRDEQPRYPPAERLLEWADRVDDAWGLECGALGEIHFETGESVSAGFDGFVIYDADEDVKEWCDERWDAVDSWSNRDQLEFPFMYPDEYDLRTDDEEWVTQTAIRMWWD